MAKKMTESEKEIKFIVKVVKKHLGHCPECESALDYIEEFGGIHCSSCGKSVEPKAVVIDWEALEYNAQVKREAEELKALLETRRRSAANAAIAKQHGYYLNMDEDTLTRVW